jgi:CHASE3 domain sensor protein
MSYYNTYETKRDQLRQVIDSNIESVCDNPSTEIDLDEIKDLIGQIAESYRQYQLEQDNDEFNYGHNVPDVYYFDDCPW